MQCSPKAASQDHDADSGSHATALWPVPARPHHPTLQMKQVNGEAGLGSCPRPPTNPQPAEGHRQG